MKHDEFIRQVQRRASSSWRSEATRATQATLAPPAERRSCGETSNLTRGIADSLCAGKGMRFSLERVFERVNQREGVQNRFSGREGRYARDCLLTTRGTLSQTGKRLPRRERGDGRS